MNRVHAIAVLATVTIKGDDIFEEIQMGHMFLPGTEFDPIFNRVTIGSTTFFTWVTAHECERANNV